MELSKKIIYMGALRQGLCVILAITLIFALNSCRLKDRTKIKTLKSTEHRYISKIDLSGIKVGYCTPSLNAPYYMVLTEEIKKNVESYGMKFLSSDGQDDIARQITAVEDLVASGVNILIVNPLDPLAIVTSVNSAVKSGIPVFTIDSGIDPSAEITSGVKADNTGNGYLIGEWMAVKIGKADVSAAIISGRQGNPVGKMKRLGFVQGFVETQLRTIGSSNLKIVSQGWGNWTNNGGLKAMEDILVAHPEVNLLFAENDAMAMGALKAIKEAGMAGKVLVAGVDGQKEADQLIISGDLGATALNSPGVMAGIMIETIVRYLNGEKNIDKNILTPAVLITKENVGQFYDPGALF
jgi:ribose transport system substrate-binding protein